MWRPWFQCQLTHVWCWMWSVWVTDDVQSISYSSMASFFRFVAKWAICRWYNLIRTCAGECDWFFHWQHKLCATFSVSVNINYRLPFKLYYRIRTLRHIRIEINHVSQNVFWVLTWVDGYISKCYRKILISANPC
jgi:hypothetical protein